MFYTWKLNFVWFLSHFLVSISTTVDKVVSMLFSQGRSNADEHTLTKLSFSTKYQRWNKIGSSTLNRRSSNFVSTLFCQRWNNVDKHALAQHSFSTTFQCWNNIGSSTLNWCISIDVVSKLFCTSAQLSFLT